MSFISTLACRGASTWNPLREGGTANRTNPCPPLSLWFLAFSRKYRFTNSIWRASLKCNFGVSTNILHFISESSPSSKCNSSHFLGGEFTTQDTPPSQWQLLALLSRPSRFLISRLRFLLRNKRSWSWSRSPSAIRTRYPVWYSCQLCDGCEYQLVIDTFLVRLLEWRVTWGLRSVVGCVSCSIDQ